MKAGERYISPDGFQLVQLIEPSYTEDEATGTETVDGWWVLGAAVEGEQENGDVFAFRMNMDGWTLVDKRLPLTTDDAFEPRPALSALPAVEL